MLMPSFRLISRRSVVAIALLTSALPAEAATQTWTGTTDAVWQTETNWNTAVPTAADTALFDAASTSNLDVTLSANASVQGLRIADPAGPISISGNPLTIGTGGIDMSTATQNLTFVGNVTIANGKQLWTVPAGRSVTAAAIPTKPGQPSNNAGMVQFSTTGTITLGTTTANIIADNQGNPWATYGLNAWAGVNAGVVVPSTVVDVDGVTTLLTDGQVNNIVADFTYSTNAVPSPSAMQFGAATPVNLSISSNRTITARGILVTAESGGGGILNSGSGGFIRPNRSTIANTSFNIIQNSSADFTIGASITNGSSSSPTQLVKSGVGRLILTNNNGYTGGTTINEGTIQVGAGGTAGGLGGSAGAVVNNGLLVFNRSNQIDVTNSITGPGAVHQIGSGQLTLGGAASTYSGGTVVSAGTLSYSSTIDAFGAGALSFDNATFLWKAADAGNTDISSKGVSFGSSGLTLNPNGNAVALANPIGSGSTGGLTITGNGSVALGGANTFSGNTTVSSGTLLATNATGSATGTGDVSVMSSATLGGTGRIAGAATIDLGGSLSPGTTGIGTLTVGSLGLSSGSTLPWNFGPATNDLVVVSNTDGLTINGGSLTIFGATSADPFSTNGTYNLFQYSGAVQGSGIASLSVANPAAGKSYSFGQSAGYVTMTIDWAGLVAEWNVTGGGSWGTASNWTPSEPDAATATAYFGPKITANSTVTLNAPKTVGAMVFNNANSYTIAGASTLTIGDGSSARAIQVSNGTHTISTGLVLASNTTFEVATSQSMAVSGQISGTGSLTKTSGGTLVLSGTNSYTGDTAINGGVLQFASGSIPSFNLSLSGGTLRYATGNTEDISAKFLTLGADGGTLDTNGNDVTLANGFGSGAGGLTKAGAGTLTLSGFNTYQGATTIHQGTLSVAADGALGDAFTNARIVLGGGRLRATAGFTTTRAVAASAASTIEVVGEADTLQIDGVISGAGSLTKAGPGTLQLNGDNSSLLDPFSGGITLAAGTVTLGGVQANGFKAIGTGPITFQNNAVLNLNRYNVTTNANSDGTLVNTIVVPEGQSGTINLGGRVTMPGAVTGAGTLNYNVAYVRDDITGDWRGFTGTVNLGVNRANPFGTDGDFRMGNGNVSFANAKLYVGADVEVQQNYAPPSSGSLETIQLVGELTGDALGTLSGNTVAGRFTNWTIGGLNTSSTYDGLITDWTGASRLTKTGTGTLTLTNTSTYTGSTAVNQGTLLLTGTISTSVMTTALSAGTLAGTGTVGALTIDNGGTVSPGAGIGTLNATLDATLAPGGNFNFEISDATGTAGTNWDVLSATGALTVTATVENPFTINLWSRSSIAPTVDGNIANFDPTQSYAWTIAQGLGGVTGFDASLFSVVTTANNGTGGFSNALDFGSFSVGVSGTDLQVLFSPGTAPADIVINVPSGSQTQSQAGYPTIATADSVTKIGAGTVVFDAANAYAGPTTVSVGTLQVSNANALAATNVTVDTGATLAIASGTTMKTPSVIVDGGTLSAATVAVNSTTGITSLAINAGTIAGAPVVTVTAGGQMSLVQDARVTVGIGGLSVAETTGGGRLDLGAGRVSIAAGGISAADLRADIIAGRNGGAWNGAAGITSSTAAASGGTRAVGYLVSGDGSAQVSFAAAGDIDLSGQVNVFDLVGINSAGKYGTGASAVWSQGDFNYDGVTNVFDLVGINTSAVYGQGNYFPAAPTASGFGSVAAVPEPAAGLLAVAGFVGLAAGCRLRHRPA
jgi:fibronectin-binding autotransporter adhesin